MFTDYVLNGQGHGSIGQGLETVRFDPGLLRPYLDRGRPCVTVNVGRRYDSDKKAVVPIYKQIPISELSRYGMHCPVANASLLPKESWIDLDTAVYRATRQRTRAWDDLRASSERTIPNAMGKMTLEYQAMTDVGEAVVDMDTLADGRTDRPLFNLHSIPLPITHADFYMSERELAVSRSSNTPLDTTLAEMMTRRVVEKIEQTTIGVETGVTYGTQTVGVGTHTGTSTVYGYTNFPYRVTRSVTAPSSANPQNVLTDVMAMIEVMNGNGFFGPFMLYHSTGYSVLLNDDYFRAGSTSAIRTVRERLLEVEGILDIRRLDFLTTGFQLLLVQMDGMVAQAINGIAPRLVQWPSQGGMRHNFKIIAIQVPLLRTPFNGAAGIVHAS